MNFGSHKPTVFKIKFYNWQLLFERLHLKRYSDAGIAISDVWTSKSGKLSDYRTSGQHIMK